MWGRNKVRLRDGGQTVVLGQGIKIKNVFSSKNLLRLGGGFLIVTLLGYFGWSHFAKADILLYYPSSCLGDWENVENLLGEPETDEESIEDQLNDQNSSRLTMPGRQVFCGNFTAGDSEDRAFRRATLKFSWHVVPKNIPENILSGEVQIETSSSTETSTDFVAGEIFEMATTTTSTESLPLSSRVKHWLNGFIAFAQEVLPEDVQKEEQGIIVSGENTVSVGTSEGEVKKESTEEEVIPTTGSVTETQIKEIVFDMASRTETSTAPDMTNPNTLEIPFDPIIPPDNTIQSYSEDDIFDISFSLDGKSWEHLVFVSVNNWQNAVFELGSISSYEELSKLQISVRGLNGIERTESILVDGMWLEVEVEDRNFVSDGVDSKRESPEANPSPSELISLEARIPLHSCAIEPFANRLPVGGSTKYEVSLKPSSPHLKYVTRLGQMPVGTYGSISPLGTSTEKMALTLSAEPEAARGSYSLVFVYDEIQSDNIAVSTVCQYSVSVE